MSENETVVSKNITRIDIAEFRQLGLLQELNRRFLHPLGLALEIIRDDDKTETLGGIWDYRADPEGMLYNVLDKEKMQLAKEFIAKQHSKRMKTMGFIIQEEDLEIENE